jgi:hypothetical protein
MFGFFGCGDGFSPAKIFSLLNAILKNHQDFDLRQGCHIFIVPNIPKREKYTK